MNNEIVSYDDLKEMSGKRSAAEIAAWLVHNNIEFLTGSRNRPFTTRLAVNAALGLIPTMSQGTTNKPAHIEVS